MKIVTIIGARPQFIKSCALSRLIQKKKNIDEIIVHTGQHYDYEMSRVFFKELKIPKSKFNLGIKSKNHGEMIGKMIKGIEKILLIEKPNYTLVYGDTNSTLAGALASRKINIPVIHVEAGLRSFDKNMPEEINRILTDNCSDILFTPSKLAVENLQKEGFKKENIFNVGDIMYDVFLKSYNNVKKINSKVDILVTIHRQENIKSKIKMKNIIKNLNKLSKNYNIIFPIHPGTKLSMKKLKIISLLSKKIRLIKPLSYFEMLSYLKSSKILITDSGGLQKEAMFARTQTLTLRDQTEWPETLRAKWNRLVEIKAYNICDYANKFINSKGINFKPYGHGDTAKLILNKIIDFNK